MSPYLTLGVTTDVVYKTSKTNLKDCSSVKWTNVTQMVCVSMV